MISMILVLTIVKYTDIIHETDDSLLHYSTSTYDVC